MKRMKQIEQEKDVLLQGLTAVDKAREWYLKQISATQEKIKHLGRMGSHVVQKKKTFFLFSVLFAKRARTTICCCLGTMDRGAARALGTTTRTSSRSKSTFSGPDKQLGTRRTSFSYESCFLKHSNFGSTSSRHVV